jgi:hypothetical protein
LLLGTRTEEVAVAMRMRERWLMTLQRQQQVLGESAAAQLQVDPCPLCPLCRLERVAAEAVVAA